MSQIIKIVDSAVIMLKEDKNMLQEEGILQAFWNFFYYFSKYELPAPTHKAIKDLFRRLELKLDKPSPEEKLIDVMKQNVKKERILCGDID